jgi:hypothetical protein
MLRAMAWDGATYQSAGQDQLVSTCPEAELEEGRDRRQAWQFSTCSVPARKRAQTRGGCAGEQVPDYSSYEVLEERLRVAVLYGSQGFTFA